VLSGGLGPNRHKLHERRPSWGRRFHVRDSDARRPSASGLSPRHRPAPAIALNIEQACETLNVSHKLWRETDRARTDSPMPATGPVTRSRTSPPAASKHLCHPTAAPQRTPRAPTAKARATTSCAASSKATPGTPSTASENRRSSPSSARSSTTAASHNSTGAASKLAGPSCDSSPPPTTCSSSGGPPALPRWRERLFHRHRRLRRSAHHLTVAAKRIDRFAPSVFTRHPLQCGISALVPLSCQSPGAEKVEICRGFANKKGHPCGWPFRSSLAGWLSVPALRTASASCSW
jgi:hypothetical protein